MLLAPRLRCRAGRRTDRKSTRLNSSHTEIYTLSLHDALPISHDIGYVRGLFADDDADGYVIDAVGTKVALPRGASDRSEEHTSELQSHRDLHSFPTRRSSDLP